MICTDRLSSYYKMESYIAHENCLFPYICDEENTYYPFLIYANNDIWISQLYNQVYWISFQKNFLTYFSEPFGEIYTVRTFKYNNTKVGDKQ